MNLNKFCDDNWYKLMDEIPYNWNRYQDGIPSVTTILSLIIDPKFEWVKRNHTQAVINAANRGKETHADAESFYRWLGKTLHPQILKFHVLHGVEVISTEQRYQKDISWTIDLVWVIDGITYNIDYKNTMHQSLKYKLQLWWYRYLNDNRWALLYLSDKKYILDTIITDMHLDLFLELKDLFFHKFKQWMFQMPKN